MRAGDGVDKCEFVTGMLKLMCAADPELLDRLETRFSEMDSSGDGRLTVEVGF